MIRKGRTLGTRRSLSSSQDDLFNRRTVFAVPLEIPKIFQSNTGHVSVGKTDIGLPAVADSGNATETTIALSGVEQDSYDTILVVKKEGRP